MPDNPTRSGQTKATPNFFSDAATNALPNDPDVTLIFGGLMGFFCKPDPVNNPTQRTCEIGVHPGDNKHKFEIRAFKKGSCQEIPLTLPPPGAIHKVTVEICRKPNGGAPVCDKAGDVKFLEVGDSFSRSDADNEKDFRWLLDLDSDLFYPENRPKNKGHFKQTIIVRHGTFYTAQKTNSTFIRVDPPNASSNPEDLGRVAYYMAADIKLSADECLSLKVNSNEVLQLPLVPNEQYEIRFINECFENSGHKCNRDKNAAQEEKRNDFHFNRKVLQFPAGHSPIFGLKIKDVGLGEPTLTFCTAGMEGLISAEVSDEAPCMGSGYGQTPGRPG